MKAPSDHFSRQAGTYSKFRPVYPEAFIRAIADLAPGKKRCLDAATGNGQAALALAGYFEQVDAIDSSRKQLREAAEHPRVFYQLQRAETTGYPDRCFDLITVAQAAHWLDHAAFYMEAGRLLRPGGILALWGYGLLRFDHPVDALIRDFYHDAVGAYWPPERRWVENAYRDLPFPYPEIDLVHRFCIEREMDQEGLQGYLYSWSSTQARIREGKDPVPAFMESLRKIWPSAGPMRAVHPLFTKIGKAP